MSKSTRSVVIKCSGITVVKDRRMQRSGTFLSEGSGLAVAFRETGVKKPFRSRLLRLALSVGFAVLTLAGAQAQDDVERRVNDLLRRMTLDEKLGQLNLISHGPPLKWEQIAQGRIGALLNFNNA